MKYMLTKINTHWETTQWVMTAKLCRLAHKVAVQLHLMAESCTICSSCSRQPFRNFWIHLHIYIVYCVFTINYDSVNYTFSLPEMSCSSCICHWVSCHDFMYNPFNIVTDCMLHDWVLIRGRGYGFFLHSQPHPCRLWIPPSLLSSEYAWSCASTSPIHLHGLVLS
jgi:hypothetical protein